MKGIRERRRPSISIGHACDRGTTMVRSQLNRRIEGRISSVMIRIWTFRVWDFEKRPFSRVHFWIKLLEITVSFISVEKFWRESFGLGLYWASLLTYCDFLSLVKNKSFIRLGFFLYVYWRLSICVINYVFWKLLLVPFWVRFVLSGRSLTRHPVEILLWFVICLWNFEKRPFDRFRFFYICILSRFW